MYKSSTVSEIPALIAKAAFMQATLCMRQPIPEHWFSQERTRKFIHFQIKTFLKIDKPLFLYIAICSSVLVPVGVSVDLVYLKHP